MYVARLGSGFMLKRMPGTGPLHAPRCPSQGLPILPTPLTTEAGREPQTKTTALTLSFSLTRPGLQTSEPRPGGTHADSVSKRGGLTLLALLHFLWNEAELNRWHPSFAGRRSWGTVRRRLFAASAGKTVGAHALSDLLYIPEVFTVARRREIRLRRSRTWESCQRARDGACRLMLLIGELKELTRTAYGSRALIKHVPDRAFRVPDQVLRRVGLDSMEELGRERSRGLHTVVIGTFSIDADGIPSMEQLDFIPMSERWVPVAADPPRCRVAFDTVSAGLANDGLRWPRIRHL